MTEAATRQLPLSLPAEETERVRCNLCGAEDATELYRRADYRLNVDDIKWPLVQCRRCGLAFVNPRPTPAGIWRYYPSWYYGDREAGNLRRRYALQEAYLADMLPGRLLDVGCANGDWIDLMAAKGWRVAGLEPSPNSANPHGLDIRRGGVDAAPWADGSFDAITAWAVFEHLHDPMAAFRGAARLLAPGGRLVVVVTNIRSVASRLAFQEDIPRHLHVFAERTLEGYAQAVGLTLRRVVHDARLFGGSGRGVLRMWLYQAVGYSPSDWFQLAKRGWPHRFGKTPLLALVEAGVYGVERVVLADWLVCALRLNGHIVAVFEQPRG